MLEKIYAKTVRMHRSLHPNFSKPLRLLQNGQGRLSIDLRPPTLNFGLKVALEDMADRLSERNQSTVSVIANIPTDGDCRYPEKVENHVYRIVQEACGNTLKYARANKIKIIARLEHAKFDIKIEDDGIGFDTGTSLRLDARAQTFRLRRYSRTHQIDWRQCTW